MRQRLSYQLEICAATIDEARSKVAQANPQASPTRKRPCRRHHDRSELGTP
jgi:hypothetical protein